MDSTKDGQAERNPNSGGDSTVAASDSNGQADSGPAEAVRGESPPLEWQHGKNLNFNNVKTVLETVREGLEKGIAQHKRELAKMIGARDSLLK